MNQGLREISSCEVCSNDTLTQVLDLGCHPMCDDLVEVGNSRKCHEYPIDIHFCTTCLTAHQHYQVPKRELFPTSYHYRSRFTADVLNGMRSLVDACEQSFGSLSGKKVVDIGCNDGSLLNFFREKGSKTIGIEPTGAAVDAIESGHTVYNDYLSSDVAEELVRTHGYPDFITFTNVFAHIEDLEGVLQSLKVLMSANTVIVIENHYLGAVLDGNQFDTFYHEHPRTYSYTSFTHMAKTLEGRILNVEFPSRYGGNIRVFIGAGNRPTAFESKSEIAITSREAAFPAAFAVLRNNIEHWKKVKGQQIAEMFAQHGKVRAKAFPGRAAILVKLLGLDEKFISAVYEKPGSLKIGHYVPGTQIEIRSDDSLFALADQAAPILNLAWHIPKEIRSYMEKNGYKGQIMDILEASNFTVNK